MIINNINIFNQIILLIRNGYKGLRIEYNGLKNRNY